MSKDKEGFFEKQSDWAKIKNDLLGSYLTVYFQKLITSRRPIYYIDCFAGKGKFDDDNLGSPLIALKIRDECLSRSKYSCQIHSLFIEAQYADELSQNVMRYGTLCNSVQVIKGNFQDEIPEILAHKIPKDSNVLLYIDPYGVKDLNAQQFESFLQMNFYSFEMLINFNSFGLFRNACRVQRIELRDEDLSEETLPELKPLELTYDEKSEELVSKVLGCKVWKTTVELYKSGAINGYFAEQNFSQLFKRQLHVMGYKYVLDMPIRLKSGNRPKYRMVHITQHPQGCIAMANNMVKRSDQLYVEIQAKQQTSLFSQDIEQNLVENEDILLRIIELLQGYSAPVSLNVFLAEFYDRYGVLCAEGKIEEQFRKLEKENKLSVKRVPEKTPTGKPTVFFSEARGQQVWIGLNR